tara:strand:+ start:319 stop:2820 length:2502 start_codon:yes stop_codon:yes gene_type:complete
MINLEKKYAISGVDVIPEITNDKQNVLVVSNKTEVFFDVFECTINGKKILVEKIDEVNNLPLVQFELFVDNHKRICKAILVEDENNGVYFNSKTLDLEKSKIQYNNIIEQTSNNKNNIENYSKEIIKSSKQQAKQFTINEDKKQINKQVKLVLGTKLDSIKNSINEKYEAFSGNDAERKTQIKLLEKKLNSIKENTKEEVDFIYDKIQIDINNTKNSIVENTKNSIDNVKHYIKEQIKTTNQNILNESHEKYTILENKFDSIKINANQNILKEDVNTLILSEKKDSPEMLKFTSKIKTDISKQFQNEMSSIKRLVEMSSGGGSVAVQYANGGVMNGDLTINGNLQVSDTINTDILSATAIYATSSFTTYIDIKEYELSGFSVTGNVSISGDLTVTENINLSGNLNIDGLVDGRDIAADGAAIDNLELDVDFLSGSIDAIDLDQVTTVGNTTTNSIQVASLTATKIIGGENSEANGDNTAVLGGLDNKAIGESSSVAGGCLNQAIGDFSNVAGGRSNQASGNNSNVAGGFGNKACGGQSFVGGGQFNCAYKINSTVGGGCNNEANGNGSAILGGEFNIVDESANCSILVGGKLNTIITGSDYSTIVGGFSSRINESSCYAIIGGGYGNIVDGDWSAILSGLSNTVGKTSSSASIIGGGTRNIVNGSVSIIGSGSDNRVCGNSSAILGGQDNETCSAYTFIGGGGENTINGGIQTTPFTFQYSNYSSIVGGYGNKVCACYSAILGGTTNTILSAHEKSFIIGSNLTSSASATTFVNNLSSQGNVYGDSITANNQIFVGANTVVQNISGVDGIQRLTQTQYDGLTPNPDILYIIVG